MTKPQIENMTAFNSDQNTVSSEVIDFSANLFFIGIPILGVDSGSVSISLLAKRRITTLTGVYTGTEVEIKTFRKELEDEANKASQPEKDYTTSDGATFSVMINTIRTARDLTSPDQITWTLELFTSAQLFG